MKYNFDEDTFIRLYNEGKSPDELSLLFRVSRRTIERWEHHLRLQGKIGYRRELATKTNRHSYKEVVQEVKQYLQYSKQFWEKYNDIYKKVTLKSVWKREKQVEDQVLLLSDLHTGMINRAPITGEITYNQEIEEKELRTLLQGIYRFANLYKPSYNIETFYIFSLGDLITNDRIYEGQKTEITFGVGKQIELTFAYISDFIRKLLEIYPRVVYINEYGNHGRSSSQIIVEDCTNNFEYLLGLLIKERFEQNPRVEVILPDDYMYTYKIRNHKYLLTHGNYIRGATLNTIEKAVKEMALLVENEYYDVITIGHFHSNYELPISPTTTLLVNGCFIYKDKYAYEKLRKHSQAKQYLFNVSKKSPIHNVQKIDLRWEVK